MIIDVDKYIARCRPQWDELSELLERRSRPGEHLSVAEAECLYALYVQASADLSRLRTFAAVPELTRYLEGLISHSYLAIYQLRSRPAFAPWRWFSRHFPGAVRQHFRALALALLFFGLGAVLGGGLLLLLPASKPVLIPFGHLRMDPSERVQQEERRERPLTLPQEGIFASQLMTHNTRVCILSAALGVTFGLGTAIMLLSNGVLLGAVCADYLAAGEGAFLAGWLLPHGSIEIPCVLLAGQAGFVLGAALLGRDSRRHRRLRAALPDFLHIAGGCAVLLIWAGLVEAFFSQHHEPALPYVVKSLFGLAQLLFLMVFLWQRSTPVASLNNTAGADEP
ncbi:stage II sporulation protein M [Oligosphaera ethanolica]|uniref:Membrane protein SpoIIM required for sporulation n=1 Tax=Oligosphaera ethanolica TaxID=760260 RepID=A0AAE4APL8_9BACT|nr:stage II sporulation protein M [Oligosphaera ethanolica]MDQ0291474.1 putative membrane protein SpoIIM required for sporulation [Oligosphaera ethanolica]